MKTHHILFVMILLNSILSYAQTKPATKTTSQKEIDRLAAKYKNLDQITVYLTNIELIGKVYVEYNQDNKPLSIGINVDSEDKEPLVEFIMNMIKQKQSQGYVSTEGRLFTSDGIRNDLDAEKTNLTFKKGNMFFKVYMWRNIWDYTAIYFDEQFRNPNLPISLADIKKKYPIVHTVRIETMDYSRKGGKNATKLDF